MELYLKVREDGEIVLTIKPKQGIHTEGTGLSSQFCSWQAKPLGLNAENVAHMALTHLGDLHVCICLLLLCFCFLGSLCVFGPKGWASISVFVAKGEPALGQLGESHWYLLSGHTLHQALQFPVSIRSFSWVTCPVEWCTCLKQAVWCWFPREVSSFSPSPSCFLVSQGWFHLRSSCLCCNLITLNFLERERHVFITKSHLSLHGLEISTHLRDLWNVSLCGRVWLTFFLTQCDCLSDAIPRLKSLIQCENGSLCLRFTP